MCVDNCLPTPTEVARFLGRWPSAGLRRPLFPRRAALRKAGFPIGTRRKVAGQAIRAW